MKILFANPPWWGKLGTYKNANNEVFKAWTAGVRAGSRWPFTRLVFASPDQPVNGEYLPYPFFMGYAASYTQRELGSKGAQVFFRDSIALRESYASFRGYIMSLRPDYLVLESATPSWEHDLEQIKLYNQLAPKMKIIVTGPITIQSEAILAKYPVYACIRGEYEKGVVKAIEGTGGAIGYDMLSKQEMNAAPYPWFDDVHALRYFDACPKGQQFPHAQVWSSRGCPFKCIFCVWPATMTGNDPDGQGTRTVRHYTPAYMEGFLKDLTRRYPYKGIYFDDDTFNLGNSHVLQMCDVMKTIKLPWSAMCRADTSKMETWQIMRDSGCYGVKLGFESGSQYVVDKIVNKHLDLDYAREVVLHIKKLGMTVHGTFTYGLPGETKEQMQETRQFIQSLPFDTIQESGTAEIEGTPLSTLTRTGNLLGYEGATIDSSYDRQRDGNTKMQRLAHLLMES